jgi:hypothetical protein
MIDLQSPRLRLIGRRFSADPAVTVVIAANQNQAVKQTVPWTAPWASHLMWMWVVCKRSLPSSLCHLGNCFPIHFFFPTRAVVQAIMIPWHFHQQCWGNENKPYSYLSFVSSHSIWKCLQVTGDETTEAPPEMKPVVPTPTSPLLTSLLKSPSPAPTAQVKEPLTVS